MNHRHKAYGSSNDVKRWIEQTFQKGECVKFTLDPHDDSKCVCGRDKESHLSRPNKLTGSWSVGKYTVYSPTDSFGTVEFGSGVKARFLRMGPNARNDDVIELMTSVWGVEPPKLLISVHGGMTNFELQPRLKRAFRRSLQRMAAIPGVWILTNGLNIGVVKHVGDALTAGVLRRNRAVIIGIAPWGVVANRRQLVVRDREVRYYPPATAPAATILNPNHTFFLLVDDGSIGKYGAEAKWRRNFESALSSSLKRHSVPLVALLVEGGSNCIRVAVDYLTDSKPIVVIEGSGRAADILSFAYRQAEDDSSKNCGSTGVLDHSKVAILNAIQRAFGVSTNRNRITLNEVILCTKRRELISIWQPVDVQGQTISSSSTSSSDELDLCVLSALLQAQRRSAPDKLSLALAWNRVDLATSQIFIEGQVWPEEALNDAMIEALIMDRVDFVKILIEHGVNMAELLTTNRLEQLYNIKHSDTWLLRHIARKLIDRQSNVRISIPDVGSIVEELMDFGYRSSYRQRLPENAKNQDSIELQVQDLSSDAGESDNNTSHPFTDLLIWSVLMRRQAMAKLMWELGEEALAKALVACRLYRSMANFLEGEVTSENIVELKKYGQEFADLSYQLLEHCHEMDEITAQQLLTYELRNFSDKTCLSLAVSAQHKPFVAHPCCQNLLSVLWMGGLRTRSSRPWKVLLGILLPPYALFGLDYLTQEELRLQPKSEQVLQNKNLHEVSADGAPVVFNYDEGSSPRTASNRLSRFRRREGSLPLLHVQIDAKLNDDSDFTTQSEKPATAAPLVQSQMSVSSPVGRPRFSMMEDFECELGRPLSVKKRFNEFYSAPVTKFWLHSLSYAFFIYCFAYTILTEQHSSYAQWPEMWITFYVMTLLADKFREVFSIDAHGVSTRLSIYFVDLWNLFDAIAIALFCIGFPLRWSTTMFEFGKAFWIIAIVFFLIRLFNIFQANEDMALYITILHEMLKRMISFLVILGVVVGTYGIVLQATRYPYRAPEWAILKDIWVEAYFNLYGEVYHEYIDTGQCDSTSKNSSDPYKPPCWCCGWIGNVAQTVYLIAANILMLNLLIAVFNNVFESVNRVSQILTKFQRYRLIVDYQLLPILPPPFIIFSHIYALCRAMNRRCRGQRYLTKDPGLLKLILSRDDEQQLHDFEWQAREELMEQREISAKQSQEELLKTTFERTEAMQLTIEQILYRQARNAGLLRDLNNLTACLSQSNRPQGHGIVTPMITTNDDADQMQPLESMNVSGMAESLPRVLIDGVEPSDAEYAKSRAIGPDVYKRLKQLSATDDNSEFCQTARNLIAQQIHSSSRTVSSYELDEDDEDKSPHNSTPND